MSLDRVSFHTSFPIPLVIAIAAGLILLFGWMEWHRKLPLKAWRITAVALAVLSLSLMVLRPHVPTIQIDPPIVLLTAGYDKSIVDSLMRRHPQQIVRMPDAAPYENAELLDGWGDLPGIAERIEFVLGHGIPPYMDNIGGLHFTFLPGHSKEGIFRWDVNKVMVNRKATISGEIRAKGKSSIILRGPGGFEDSITIQGSKTFTLHFLPKNKGNYLYFCEVSNDAGVDSFSFPVSVLPERKLNILMAQPFPTFETRPLKNFLADKGHALSVRYQVSRNQYRTEFANTNRQNLNNLNAGLLKNMDVFITTPPTLENLSSTEWTVLKESIRQGLGMVILLDGPLPIPPRTHSLIEIEAKSFEKDTVEIILPWSGRKSKMIAPSIQLSTSPTLHVLQTELNGWPTAGFTFLGKGRIGFQLLPATYRLALEGQLEDYSSLWVPLLEGVAREERRPFDVRVTSAFPYYADEPIQIDVISAGDQPMLTADGIHVPLEEDVVTDDLWRGMVVGGQGWHQLMTQDSVRTPYFISAPHEWSTLRVESQKKLNRRISPGQGGTDFSHETHQAIPPLLFFLIFLASAGFLWLAPKL